MLSESRFRLFIIARLFFTLAVNMQGTLLAWYLYEITKDAFYLGLTGLAEIIPFVITLFPGGALADQASRPRIMLMSMMAFGLINLCFFAYSGTHPGIEQVWPLYLLISLTGVARGFLSPAQNAILGQLVDRSRLARAATWNSAVFQSGQVLGPAIGGLLYGFWGPEKSFLVVALLIAISLFFVLNLSGLPAPIGNKHPEPASLRIRKGIQFVSGHPLLFPAMLLDMVAVLFGGAVAVLPLFADQILHTGPEGLGWLRAAPAIGSVISSAILLRFPPGARAGKRMLLAVAGFGLCNLLFSLSTTFFLSLFLLFMGGMFDSYSMVIRGALLQLCTPDEMKGRVSAVNSVFIGSSNELGSFESGIAARLMGLVPSVIFGSLITFASTAVAAMRAKSLVQLDLRKTNL
jgi:MFS family permease